MDNARVSVFQDLRYGIQPLRGAIQSGNLMLQSLLKPLESGDAEIRL